MVRGQCQAVGQHDGVARQRQPAAQVGVGVEHLLLMQRVLVVVGNMQGLDQAPLIGAQQAITLNDPVRQPPMLSKP